MADRSHKARSGLTLLALVAAGLIAGLWLYLLQTDVVGQMRRAEDERCYLHLEHLRRDLGGELDRLFLEAQEMGTAVSIDTQSQSSFRRLSEAPADSLAPEPPYARAILLFGLGRQEKYTEAMALFPTSNEELSGDLVLLKARCLASLGRFDEARFLLQQARASGGYQVFGPLPFWVLAVLLEAKLGSPKQRQQLIQEIVESENELTAKSALTLADLLPSDCKEPLSRFLLRARLFRAMESNPMDLEDSSWQAHPLGAVRKRSEFFDLLEQSTVEEAAKKVSESSDLGGILISGNARPRSRVKGTILPSQRLVFLRPVAVGARALIEGLSRILPVLAVLLAALGVWMYVRDLRREIAVTRLKSNFIDVVTHELRTPLTILALKTEMLALGSVPVQKMGEYAEDAHAEAGKLSRLMERLLDFKKLDSGHLQLELQVIDLLSFLHEVQRELHPLAAPSGRVIHVHESSEARSVRGDVDVLASVMRNLVENALKYAPVGDIDLGCADHGDWIRLSVEDRGPGVLAAEKAHIFERFNRGAAAADGAQRGVGLGLAFVQLAISSHQGRCGVEDRPGGGALFFVELPKR